MSCKYKTINFYAKCNDLFDATLVDEDGVETEHEGEAFVFLGDGDGISLKIDLETGQILNWKPPTDKDFIVDDKYDDEDEYYNPEPEFAPDDDDSINKVLEESNKKHKKQIDTAFRIKFGLPHNNDLIKLLKNKDANKVYNLFISSGEYKDYI